MTDSGGLKMENYAKLQMRNIIILLTIGLFVSFIPIHVMADSASGSDTMPINPYPDKIYGAEFRSAESPLGVAWDFAHNDLTNSNNNTDWNVEFLSHSGLNGSIDTVGTE